MLQLTSVIMYLQTAIRAAARRGILFMASAGNAGDDTDKVPHPPSSLPDDIIVAVAALDANGSKLWSVQ